MVISNKARQHSGIMDGITYEEPRGRRHDVFNEKGDELGGLVFDGNNEFSQGDKESLKLTETQN